MTIQTITDIFKEYLEGYLKANKSGKSMILNHVCFVTKMHRKASVRKFSRLQFRDPYLNERRGWNEYYGPDVTYALKDIWEAGNEVCGELPFPVINEFINKMAFDWCRQQKIKYVRSRSGRKNDNMYVEERNGHVIRKMVGYINLDCEEVVDVLNEYYDVMTLYLIHFVCVRRMIGKEKSGSKYIRIYEKVPKTPSQRILENEYVKDEVKEK